MPSLITWSIADNSDSISCLVKIFHKSFDPPYFTLIDGSIVNLDMQGMMNDITVSSSWYRSEYFDIDMLYSLTLYGEVYFFD